MASRREIWAALGGRMRIAAICLAGLVLFAACDKGATPAADKASPVKQAAKAKKEGPVIPTLPPPEPPSAFDEKNFDPKGMRDPFKPFIKIEKAAKKGQKKAIITVAKTPLQRFALEELKFVGILWSPEKAPEALVEDPTGKGYKIPNGTYVGNRGAKIVKIEKDQVVIEERTEDVLGEESVNLTTIKLHKPGNEVNP